MRFGHALIPLEPLPRLFAALENRRCSPCPSPICPKQVDLLRPHRWWQASSRHLNRHRHRHRWPSRRLLPRRGARPCSPTLVTAAVKWATAASGRSGGLQSSSAAPEKENLLRPGGGVGVGHQMHRYRQLAGRATSHRSKVHQPQSCRVRGGGGKSRQGCVHSESQSPGPAAVASPLSDV